MTEKIDTKKQNPFNEILLEYAIDSFQKEVLKAFKTLKLLDTLNVLESFERQVLKTFETWAIETLQAEEPSFNKNLLRKVDELELSVRSANCLKNENIRYIGDLVQWKGNDLLRIPNFGRKSLNEIKEALSLMGLGFEMTILNWPDTVRGIETLAKKYEGVYDD